MSKILKIYSYINNPNWEKGWDEAWGKLSKWKKLECKILWTSIGNKEPYEIKNPRVAEIFAQNKFNMIKNWHISNGYFYIEVADHFKTEEGEVYES